MPELPDVETFRLYFNKKALNREILAIKVFHPKVLRQVSEKKARQELLHQKFKSTKRHGKNLFAALSNGLYLCFHFGMTGSFLFYKKGNLPPFTRFQIDFKEGHLAYIDMRILGGLTITDSIEDFIEKKDLGPDALSIQWDDFKTILKRKGTLKPTLMDQSFIAGVGNIYADEILFQAKLNPLRNNFSLSLKEAKTLFTQMKKVLKKAIAIKADVNQMSKTWLLPSRKTHENCPRCKKEIKRITLRGRGTFFCPHCQK